MSATSPLALWEGIVPAESATKVSAAVSARPPDEVTASGSSGKSMGGDSKLCKLYLGSVLESGIIPCLGLVGDLNALRFCVRPSTSCTTRHRNIAGSKFHWSPQRLYVRADNWMAFCSPSVHTDQVESDLLAKWLKDKTSASEWCKRFATIQAVDDVATLGDVSQRLDFLNRADGIKTPKKLKEWEDVHSPFDTLAFVKSLPESRDKWVNSKTLPVGFLDAFILMENGLEEVSDRLSQIQIKSDSREQAFTEDLMQVSLKVSQIQNLSGIQGDRDTTIVTDLSPSSIAELRRSILTEANTSFCAAMELNNVSLLRDFETRLRKECEPIRDVVEYVRTNFATHVLDKIKTLEDNIESIREDQTAVLVGSRGLGLSATDPFSRHEDEKKMERLVHDQVQRNMSTLSNRLDKFERDMRNDGVRFGDLGISNIDEMYAWVEKFIPDNKFGCFVDAVSICQFLSTSYITPESELRNMESVQRLGMVSGQEARVITSFQNILPGIFGGDDDFTKPLPAVSTPKKWTDPKTGTGLKDDVRRGLVSVNTQIEAQIRQLQTSEAQTLARACLMASVHFLSEMSTYLSTVFEELKNGGFEADGAWTLACKLIRRIFEDMFEVRVYAKDARKRGDDRTTTAMILFATLKAHDVMSQFLHANFENHPAIASEYVKLLARNSSTGSYTAMSNLLDKLVERATLLESSKTMVKKTMDTLRRRGIRQCKHWSLTC